MQTTKSTKGVLIVEDHMIVRAALISELQRFPESFHLLGEAKDALLGLKMAASLKPQVVFLDHTLAQSTGIQMLAELKKLNLNIQVIVFTQNLNPHILKIYWESDVTALLNKSAEIAELHTALKALLSGQRFLSNDFEKLIFANPEKLLSKRELEVVAMVAKGLSNKQVAEALCCSDQTIKTHKTNIMRKLGISNSVELTVWAAENGVV